MPTYDEMRNLLTDRFTAPNGTEATATVNGAVITLSQDPHFRTYANIGALLSDPARKAEIKGALQELEAAMIEKIRGIWVFSDKAKTGTAYYNARETSTKNTDFTHLLSSALADFERSHGFVVPTKIPTFCGFVFGNVFKETIRNRMPFKDIGAGENHGEFTHRLQWYVAVKCGGIVTGRPTDAGAIYGHIHHWMNIRAVPGGNLLQLWNYVFDMNNPLLVGGEVLDDSDFRSPENFQRWLTGASEPDVCPLLRAFLRSRKRKRATFLIEDYFIKKLGPVVGPAAHEAWLTAGNRPSAQLLHSDTGVPGYVSHVGAVPMRRV